MIPVTCKCGKNLTYTPEFAGKRVKCSKCAAPVQVPADPKRAVVRTCKAHPQNRAVGTCGRCRAPICSDCRAALGYYCSEACKATAEKAEAGVGKNASPAEQARVARIAKVVKFGFLAAAAVLVVFLGVRLVKRLAFRGGQTAWSVDLKDEYARDLFESGGALCLLTGSGRIVKYDPESGRSVGQIGLADESASVIARTEDTLLVGGEKGLSGIRLSDGAVLWSHGSSRWEALSLARWDFTGETPLIDGGRIFSRELPGSFTEKEKPALSALDVKTGKKIWTKELAQEGWIRDIRSGFGRVCVYLQSEFERAAASLVVLDGASGDVLWSRELKLGRESWPRMTEKGILVLSPDGLRLHGFADGKPAWDVPLQVAGADRETGDIWVDKGRVYLHFNARVACIELADGKVRWQAAAPIYVSALSFGPRCVIISGYAEEDLKEKLNDPTLLLAGKEILRDVVLKEFPGMTSLKSFLYAFDGDTGKVIWQQMGAGGKFQPVGDYLLSWGTLNAPNLLDPTKRDVSRETIRLIDPSTGEPLWAFETDSVATPFVAIGKRIFFARSRAGHSPTGPDGLTVPAKPIESRLEAIYVK